MKKYILLLLLSLGMVPAFADDSDVEDYDDTIGRSVSAPTTDPTEPAENLNQDMSLIDSAKPAELKMQEPAFDDEDDDFSED